MIEWRRFEGKNLEEAIKKACEFFNKSKEELDIKVIEPGSSGFFGIKAKKSVIEAIPKITSDEDLKAFTESVTKKILSFISKEPKVEVVKENERLIVRLDVGKDIGLVIGKERQNLNALELLVNLIVGKKIMERVDLKLEVIGAKELQKRTPKLQNTKRINSFGVKRGVTNSTKKPKTFNSKDSDKKVEKSKKTFYSKQ